MDKLNSDNGIQVPPQMNEMLQQAGDFVKAFQERFGNTVWNPGKQHSREFAASYPIAATFLAIFLGLAAIPVASYLVFITFILISSISFCVALAIGITLFVGFWTGILLFFTLILILLFATVATLGLLGGFIAFRLLYHIRSVDGGGVHGWAAETRDRIVPPGVQQYAGDTKKHAEGYYAALKGDNTKVEQL